MNEPLVRPKPIGVAPSGRPLYDPEEIAAYRMACGITQTQVADALKLTQTMVVLWEQPGSRVKVPRLDEELGVIERIVARRDAMIANGTAALAEVRERCRVAVTKGTSGRLEKCGKLTAPGLVTCAAHVDFHETMVDTATREWKARVGSVSTPTRSALPRRATSPSPSETR